jgi:hypothetical protein
VSKFITAGCRCMCGLQPGRTGHGLAPARNRPGRLRSPGEVVCLLRTGAEGGDRGRRG